MSGWCGPVDFLFVLAGWLAGFSAGSLTFDYASKITIYQRPINCAAGPPSLSHLKSFSFHSTRLLIVIFVMFESQPQNKFIKVYNTFLCMVLYEFCSAHLEWSLHLVYIFSIKRETQFFKNSNNLFRLLSALNLFKSINSHQNDSA